MRPPSEIRPEDLFVRAALPTEVVEALADCGLSDLDAIDRALVDGRLAALVAERGSGIGRGTWAQVVYARTRVRMTAPRPAGRPAFRGRCVALRLSAADSEWLVRRSLEVGCTQADLARRALALIDARLRHPGDVEPLLAALRHQLVELRHPGPGSAQLRVHLPSWLDGRAEAAAARLGACTTPEVVRLAVAAARRTSARSSAHDHVLRSSPERAEALLLSAQHRALDVAS